MKSYIEGLKAKGYKGIATGEEFRGKQIHVQKNYIEYLSHCYDAHYDAILTPDYLWYTMLAEIAKRIKSQPKQYRELFTTKAEGKTEISILTDNPERIDLETLKNALVTVVPSDTTGFFPDFTTSTESSRTAFRAAFADSLSPYYNYSTFMCKVPKVRVDGTKEDWDLLKNHLNQLGQLLKLTKWTDHVQTIVDSHILTENDRPIFKLERCGSGSDNTVKGWWTELYLSTDHKQLAKLSNFPTHLSEVKYTNLDTGRKFMVTYGLMISTKPGDDNFSTPQFSYILNELLKKNVKNEDDIHDRELAEISR